MSNQTEIETDRIRRIYDERAPTYDRSLGLVERIAVAPLRRQFGALLSGETLEVGVGSGLNLPYYAPAVTRAVGVDLSAEMLLHAQGRAQDLPFPATCVQADASALPFSGETFDTVAISLALCTIPDPAQALREVARVCRPDGRVVLLRARSRACPTAGHAATHPLAAQRTRHRLSPRPGHLRLGPLPRVYGRTSRQPPVRYLPARGGAAAGITSCYPRLIEFAPGGMPA